MSIKNKKLELRNHMLQVRAQITLEERTIKSEQICNHMIQFLKGTLNKKQPIKLLMYMPFKNEVDITPLMDWCWKSGGSVFLPKVVHNYEMEIHHIHSLQDVEAGKFGILEPKSNTDICHDLSQIKIVIVPGIAFHSSGGRLGFGGGYYDRFFSRYDKLGIKQPYKIAVAYDAQIVENIPIEEHDYRMDQVITEKGVL
ncbi:5-formyltetrahydrofolate cyclo-ligase [Chengkuizengella axinellae]|uniref:5-formyltetrahydrofolate cyclo-ligase n=1 Tax=Chengkuizengella axinellae TaxID=3064388 RepID=A0ABT9J6Q6_9BACL|nr:5-formyltetrahydrofolate cyclo-ligase [Chengkuizengella sp. 2205SS18-9]MDP5276644.1 5-formyltetrahydrofolate cyclo-ligase [Chengkuizengella sp. 2205SS18-9]